MIRRFTVLGLLLLSFTSYAQNIAYENPEGDALIVQNDTVFIKLCNNDAFATYGLYYGRGELISSAPDKGKQLLHLGENSIRSSCAVMRCEDVKDSPTNIHVIDFDGRPIEYATVAVIGDNGEHIFQGLTDQDGHIVLEDCVAHGSREVIIYSLGKNCQLKTRLEHGGHYEVRFRVPFPFTEMHGGKRLKIMASDSSITVVYNKTNHILKKVSEATSTLF